MPGVRKGRAVFLAASLLVAGFVGLTWAQYRREIEQERRRASTGSQIVKTPCGLIEYAATGSGPPVLLVHGAGGGYDQGLSLGVPLARRGLYVIAMPRFGYLRTPLPADASAAAQADAHACLLDVLGIRRAAIAGAPAGAPSAMQFVLRHPDRSSALVLLVPAVYVPRSGGAPPLKTPAGTQFLFETALKSDFLLVKNADAAEKVRVGELLRQILPVCTRRAGLLNDAAVTSALPRYDLERVAVPTLVISMADDLFGTFDGARYTAEHVPGAQFKGYPSGGHVWVGHHKEIVAEIAAFLK